VKRVIPGLLLFALGSAPALATTCIPHTMGPEDIVAADLVVQGTTYDFALVGQVLSVETDEQSDSDRYGETVVRMSVFGVYGLASAPTEMGLTTPDPGWINGYDFVVGSSYFVPVMRIGLDGEANRVNACDPVTEVEDPQATALDLAVVADRNGVDYALPFQTGNGGGSVTVFVIVLLILLLLWTLGRRRSWRDQFGGTGSHPRRPLPPRR
jgi:hypothetical protein